jgi:rRNA maturation endonuclease Nob1
MGIFNTLGRQIEQFKQNAKDAADETAEYQCQACDARFHTEYDECPDCGADDVTAHSGRE